jgi:hypothetical protein
MRWSLVRGAVVVVAAGASLLAIDTSADATQLICLNAQNQFVACKAGTVPANPYVVSPQSTASPSTTIRRAPAVTTVPSTIPAPANVAPAPARTTHATPSGRKAIEREALPIGVAVLMLGAAAVGFVLEVRRRGHSAGEEAGVADTAIVVTAAAGVLSGLILLVLGVASDSRPTLYESIGLAALTGLLLIVLHRFFPGVERPDETGVPSTWAESALARVPADASAQRVATSTSAAAPDNRPRPFAEADHPHDVSVADAVLPAPTEPATDTAGRQALIDDGFPITNYDELSTVQIVSLLPHLDTDQITAVRAREEAGKGRVSILRRLDSVLDPPTPDRGQQPDAGSSGATDRVQESEAAGEAVEKPAPPDAASSPDEQPLDQQPPDEQPLDQQPPDEQPLDEQPPDAASSPDEQPQDKQPPDQQPHDQQPPDEPRPVATPERVNGEHSTVARSNGHLRAAPPATPAGPDPPDVSSANGRPKPERTGSDAPPAQPRPRAEAERRQPPAATRPPDATRPPAVTRPAAAVTRRTAVAGPATTTFRLPVARDLVDGTFGVATFRRLSQAARDAVRDGLRQNRVIEAANSAANYLALGHAVDWSRQTQQRMVRDWRASIDDDGDHERLERAASRCAYLRLLRSDLPDDVDRYVVALRDRVEQKLDQRQLDLQATGAAVYLFWITGEWLPNEDATPRVILAVQSDVATRLQRDGDRVVVAALTALWLGATRASRSSFGRS